MPMNASNQTQASTHITQAASIWDKLPESKLELIDGRLIVGNSQAGSRYLLWAILQLLGPRAALALAPLDQWWAALATAYQASPLLASQSAWEHWAAGVAHTPHIPPAGPRFAWQHHDVYSELMLGLSLVLREGDRLGSSIQRFTMRLGEDALASEPQITLRRAEDASPRQRAAFDNQVVDVRF